MNWLLSRGVQFAGSLMRSNTKEFNASCLVHRIEGLQAVKGLTACLLHLVELLASHSSKSIEVFHFTSDFP